MARGLAVMLAALALAGCGTVPASSAPGASASPTAFAARLADNDNGRTVGVVVGDRLQVSLSQRSGYTTWQQPMSSDPSVLQPLSSSGASPQGTTVAAFRALRAGRADLSAFSSFACSPGVYCPAVAQIWRVTVTVS